MASMNVKQYREKFSKELSDAGLENLTDRELSKAIWNQSFENQKDSPYKNYDEFEDAFLITKPEDNVSLYRLEYQDNNPELKNLSDLEIADMIYDFKTSKGEKLNYKKFINDFAPKDVVSEQDQYIYSGPDADLIFSGPNEYSVKEIAEVTGIQQPSGEVFDMTKEALRGGSYAVDEQNKALAYKNVLSKTFGEDVTIRRGPKTGELEFLNPKTNQYVLINKPGLGAEDFYGLEGDAIVIMPEILGNVAGFAAGGPYGSVAAGATLAAAGDYARLKIGQNLYGINKDKTDGELFKEAVKTGTFTGVLGAGGVALPKIKKIVDNMIEGRSVDADQLLPFVKNAEEAQKIADELNLQLEVAGLKKRLKFNLAQASDDPRLLSIQAKYENQPSTAIGMKFKKFNDEQAEALNEYFKATKINPYNVKSGILKGKSIGADEFGERIQALVKARQDPKIQEVLNRLTNAEDDLTQATFQLSDGSTKEAGTKIKDFISAAMADVDKTYSDLYEKLYKIEPNLTIKQDKITKAVESLTDQERQNLFTKLPKIQEFIKLKTKDVPNLVPDGKGGLKEVIEKVPADEISIRTATNTLSAIKQFQRQAVQKGEPTPFGGALKKVAAAIDESINDLGPDSAFRDQYFDLNRSYKQARDQFRNVLGDIVEVKGGRARIADEDVFDTTFKKGPSQIERIDRTYDVLKRNPEALDTYRDNILGFYKRKVVNPNTGEVNPLKHATFMRDYEYSLKKFFDVNDAGFKQLEKIGNLSKKVAENKKNKTAVLQGLNKTLDGELANADPDLIFSKLYNPKAVGKLQKGMEIMKKDPEILAAFKSVVKDDLEMGIKNEKGIFDLKAFNRYLRDNDRTLEIVFGKEYVNGLETLRNGLTIATRKGKAPIDKAPIVNGLVRSYVGLFTREGRILTAASRIYRRKADELLADMILNPDKIKKYKELTKVNPKSQQAAAILSQLGAQEFINLPGEPRKQDIETLPKGIDVDTLPSIDLGRPILMPGLTPQEKPEEMQQQSAAPQPQQPQGIAALPSQPAQTQQTIDKGQQYAGLFPQDPLGQAIARG